MVFRLIQDRFLRQRHKYLRFLVADPLDMPRRDRDLLPRKPVPRLDQHIGDSPVLVIHDKIRHVPDLVVTHLDVIALQAHGAGPVGLATLLTTQFYAPARIIVIDLDDKRLEVAKRLGATAVINSTDGKAVEKVMAMTSGKGVEVAIEAVGIPATFEMCQEIVGAGGHIANIGVHGVGVTLHLEKLWPQNITITTRLVDAVTTPLLLKTVMAGRLKPKQLITHHFTLDEIMKAYDTFGNAGREHALKVIITNQAPLPHDVRSSGAPQNSKPKKT